MKVRDVLTPLSKDALKNLCLIRDQYVSGNKDELLTRLAYHYHGNLRSVVTDLRRTDLLAICSELSDVVDFPPKLACLPVAGLREVCLAVFEGWYVHIHYIEKARSTRAIFSDSRNSRAKGDDRRIRLYANSNDSGASLENFNIDKLIEVARSTSSVTIFSAFYRVDTLEQIANACSGDVKIVLNGSRGSSLAEQVCELEELRDRIYKRNRSVQIKLAFAKGLFHSKLYLFGRREVWIGSANATESGLNGGNEEVLLRLSPVPPSVSNYVRSVLARAESIETHQSVVNSLIAFFRTGLLYYKPYAQLQLTLNPFAEKLKQLSQDDLDKFTTFSPSYASDESGIRAFNISKALDLTIPSVLSSESAGTGQKVQLRRYAIETCYGYWVAEPLVEALNKRLDEDAEAKLDRLMKFRERLSSNEDKVINAYKRYLRDVRDFLDKEKIDWQKTYQWDKNLFKNTDPLIKRIKRLLADLDPENPKKLERFTRAFVDGRVPELWEDQESSELFTESFFDSLVRAQSAGSETGSAMLILRSLNITEGTHEEIQYRLEEELAAGDSDWYENFKLRAKKRYPQITGD